MIGRIAEAVAWAWLAWHAGASATPAWAHAFPERSQPRVGSTIDQPPPEVRIWFDGRLEPLFSTITVVDQQAHRVGGEQGGVDADDATQLATPLPPLPPGVYRVRWDVIAVDGHRTEGNFTFTIRGP
ncbi:MAG: copper resistance protein CopC [Nitrospirota bacterium]